MKGYIALEGTFYTNWEFYNYKVFSTKKALIEYMNEQHGCKFRRNLSSMYNGEFHYENNELQYGFNIEEVEIITKRKEEK